MGHLEDKTKSFVVVLRGPAAAIFREGESMQLLGFPSAVGPVDIEFTTRWLKQESGALLPGDVWIQVTGTGDSLESVLVPFGNAGLSLLPAVAICTNAAIGEPEKIGRAHV